MPKKKKTKESTAMIKKYYFVTNTACIYDESLFEPKHNAIIDNENSNNDYNYTIIIIKNIS